MPMFLLLHSRDDAARGDGLVVTEEKHSHTVDDEILDTRRETSSYCAIRPRKPAWMKRHTLLLSSHGYLQFFFV
jgi:hypothetical protein